MSVLWTLCAVGWAAVFVRLRAGTRGRARGPALYAHTATPAAVVLLFSLVGFGFLHATIALAAEWWALLLVTGFRPERLVSSGGLGRLAAWAAVAVAAALTATRFVFQI